MSGIYYTLTAVQVVCKILEMDITFCEFLVLGPSECNINQLATESAKGSAVGVPQFQTRKEYRLYEDAAFELRQHTAEVPSLWVSQYVLPACSPVTCLSCF